MLRAACLFLTVLTGASALVYEVAWQKYLATLLGSHGEATAAVLAIFLGGLAAGYALFARLAARVARRHGADQPPALLRLYGAVELAIGVHALLFPLLFGVAQTLSLWVPRGHAAPAFAFDVVLSALLIGPPAVAMGGTIPLLTQALSRDVAHATRVHAWVYGSNTLGAFAGALAGGMWLVPALGLDGTLRATACVNLFAGLSFALLSRRAGALAPVVDAEPDAAQEASRFTAYAAVALLAGFSMMSVQAIFNRIGALALGSSHYTFAMVVAVFVLCIALGSLAVSALPRIPPGVVYGTLWALVGLLACLYPFVPDAGYWTHAIRALFRSVDASFYPYHALVFVGLFAVLALPIALSGALLPLLFHQLRRENADLGATAGRLYAWNTVGSLLGALGGGYLLLIWLDLHHVYRVALGALALGAVILTLRVTGKRAGLFDALAVLGLFGAIAAFPAWDPARLAAGTFRMHEPAAASFLGPEEFFRQRQLGDIVFYDDDPTSTVSVVQPPQREDKHPNRAIVVNGKSDGSLLGDYTTMAMLALVPALFADHPERCFVIGWGTGVTAGELGALAETREVQVAEISQGVLDAAPLFAEGNLAASSNPKIRTFRGDAYRTLLQSPDVFDVIVSEPSNPWVTGVEMLYSIEFLEAAKARLAPGGVYGQWFHLYETDRAVVELVLRNFAHVFPHVSVWFTQHSDLMLLGLPDESRGLDLERLQARFDRPDFRAAFERLHIDRLSALLAHELLPLGTVNAASLAGPLHTLRHPILSDIATRAFFRGEGTPLPRLLEPASAAVGARNSLVRRYIASQGDSETVIEEVTRETCGLDRRVECAALFARWGHDHPNSPRLAAALVEVQKAYTGDAVVHAENLSQLVPLFDADDARNEADGSRPLVHADRIANDFLLYYHHAVPFDRRVLTRAWNRCTIPACEEPRQVLEKEVGPLAASR
jgi:predicted membrane-bound spermidine synthase